MGLSRGREAASAWGSLLPALRCLQRHPGGERRRPPTTASAVAIAPNSSCDGQMAPLPQSSVRRGARPVLEPARLDLGANPPAEGWPPGRPHRRGDDEAHAVATAGARC